MCIQLYIIKAHSVRWGHDRIDFRKQFRFYHVAPDLLMPGWWEMDLQHSCAFFSSFHKHNLVFRYSNSVQPAAMSARRGSASFVPKALPFKIHHSQADAGKSKTNLHVWKVVILMSTNVFQHSDPSVEEGCCMEIWLPWHQGDSSRDLEALCYWRQKSMSTHCWLLSFILQ